jgi:hypothetical protein
MADEIRQYLVDQLKPLLPEKWRWYAYNTNLDNLSTPVAMLWLQTITRTPEAPMGFRSTTFLLTIVEPKQDPAQREDPLDENLIELVDAIDTIPNVRWTRAERATFQDTYLAFDITLEIITKKDVIKNEVVTSLDAPISTETETP